MYNQPVPIFLKTIKKIIDQKEIYLEDTFHQHVRKKIYAIHFLFETGNSSEKDRLKFIIKNSDKERIKVDYSPKYKMRSKSGYLDYQVYIENKSRKKYIDNTIIDFLNKRSPILCCYAKDKSKYIYKNRNNGYKLKIGIDKVVAFNPTNIQEKSFPFYHIEFESTQKKILDRFFESDLFNIHLNRYLKQITTSESKWYQAKPYCRNRPKLRFADVAELEQYILSIKKQTLCLPLILPSLM